MRFSRRPCPYLRKYAFTMIFINFCFFIFKRNKLAFFDLIEVNLKGVSCHIQNFFEIQYYVINTIELPNSNAKIEVFNKIINSIKHKTFEFKNFILKYSSFWVLKVSESDPFSLSLENGKETAMSHTLQLTKSPIKNACLRKVF